MSETIVNNILYGTVVLLIIVIVVYVRESRVDYYPWQTFKRWVRATYFNRRKDPNGVVILNYRRKDDA